MSKKANSGQVAIAAAVRNIVEADVTVQDALYRGIANLSAVARTDKPILEKRTNKKEKDESIISAFKSLSVQCKSLISSILSIIALSSVSVITDVSKIVLDR